MIRILHTGCKLCKNGGIENYIMNHYREIDAGKYSFVFVVETDTEDTDTFEEEIRRLGGDIYYINRNASFLAKMKAKFSAFKNANCDIAHIHVSCGVRAIDGVLCKLANVRSKIIFHSHSNIGKRPLKYTLLIPLYRLLGNKLLACSKPAGQYFFGTGVLKSSKFLVAKNAIKVEKYEFSAAKRAEIRKQYAIDTEALVIGFIGRLSPEKNIPYLIDIVAEIKHSRPEVKAFIVGDGPERPALEAKVREAHLEDTILFTGNQTEVEKYLCGMDVFVLPSTNEGLGIVLIEAQAASLTCYATDRAPMETNISNLIHYFSIEAPAAQNAAMILKNDILQPADRSNAPSFVKENGFDIYTSTRLLENTYNELI